MSDVQGKIEFIFGDIRVPQVFPVFFKFLDFIFGHISLNNWATTFMVMTDDFSDFVGFAIDTSDVDPFTTFNDKFARDIGMNLLLLYQMMGINLQLIFIVKIR